MSELVIKRDFDSAHTIREGSGFMEPIHGHTWKIEIIVVNPSSPAEKDILNTEIDNLLAGIDHTDLNKIIGTNKGFPTTENIAGYIFKKLSIIIGKDKIKSVAVSEEYGCSTTYHGG